MEFMQFILSTKFKTDYAHTVAIYMLLLLLNTFSTFLSIEDEFFVKNQNHETSNMLKKKNH